MIEKSARILIVEDDEDDFVIARDCLEELDEYSFKIDWVSTPDAALNQLKLNQHDICLLDYQLGALTGLTVLNKVSEIQCTVPIIMLTGQSDKVLDKAALDAGAVDFIVKNELDSPRFARAIRYAIARKEVEKERLERIDIEIKSRSKDRFLAHLSHELRTPLTSILGYTELLLCEQKADPVKNELNIILNNGKHLLSLLNDVLDLSKIAANKLELALTSINLNSVLVDVYTLMQVAAKDKGIDFTLKSTTPLPEIIHTDPTRLRQILINLIHNGIKFTDTGSVTVSVKAIEQENQYQLFFEVKDTGRGIPAKELDKIFQPFEQIEDIISRKEAGAGLGLAISSELATKMDGGITANSIMGEGSCFTINIACDKTENNTFSHLSLNRSKVNDVHKSLEMLTGRVLVVDDIPEIRLLIGHILRTYGLTVDFAENGKVALDKVKASAVNNMHYDVIMMDIHMPEMDGKQAVVKIREYGFNQHILALTAATMKGVKENLRTLGFDHVISKPIDKMVLYKQLSKVLKSADWSKKPDTIQANKPMLDPISRCFMLVEDDIDAAEITKLLLESFGIEVVVAHSAKACKALLNTKEHWDKILLDLNLPDENGLALAKHITAQTCTDEIVLVSGAEIEPISLEKNGISRALLKPINKEKLTQLIDK